MGRDIDDIGLRNIYKKERFGDKRTSTDDYTGRKLNKDNAGLSRKHPSSSVCNVDHVSPIDRINEKYDDLNQMQRTELANDKSNLAYTNEYINKSKGAMTNIEYIKKQRENGTPLDKTTERNMRRAQIKSEVNMSINATKMRLEDRIEKNSPSFARKYFDRYDAEDDE